MCNPIKTDSMMYMKRIILKTVFLFIICNCALGQTNVYDSIYYGGRWRTFMTHLPTGYNTSTNYPLVLAFHGGSPLGYQSIQYQSRLSPKADSSSFVLIYPEGVKIAGNRTWNAGGCCAPATTLNIDDIGFVNALLDTSFNNWSIDTTRVYATGFSNGSLLCYRLANQLTKRFAAIAPVAGDLMYYPWTLSQAIPIISFHSYQDSNILYFGGVTIGPTGTYFPPQDSMFNIISSNYNCSIIKDTIYHDSLHYDHFLYSNCDCNVIIEQYVSYDGEHSWPGGFATGGVTVSNQFSATKLMWQFFQNYTTSCNTTGIKEKSNTQNSFEIFPNPCNGIITINLTSEIFNIIIFDYLGRKVNEKYRATGKCQIDCAELTKGIYLIQANSDTRILTGKFIKQ